MSERGCVRPARRPPGWSAPGTRPATPAAGSDLWPGDGEDLCYLAGDWRILQKRRGHRWSLDDLVTAAFAADAANGAPPRRVLDLGCGIGAVLLLLAWRFPGSRGLGVEAQAASVDLARRSIAWNDCADRCEVTLADLRDPSAFPPGSFDRVTGTPPYLPLGSATPPRRAEQPGCHLELRGGIEDYARAAARALAPGGRFVVCHAARERDRVRRAADAAGLALRAVRDVVPREGKAPLFAVFAMELAGASPATREARDIPPAPALRATSPRRGEVRRSTTPEELPPLVVRDAEGRRTAALVALRATMGMPP